MGRGAGSRAAPRHLVRSGAAVPRDGGTLRPHPPGIGRQTRGAGGDGRDRPGLCQCRADRRSGVRMAVPVACQHGSGLCQADGATLWTGSQKPHFARDGVARALGLPPDKVHGIWVPGPGSYGRNDAGDAGIDAALLSKAVGRPVRVPGMRYEGHAWDPKGPASIHRARAALDKDGLVIGYVLASKGFSRIDIDTNESDPSDSLAGQLMGLPLKSLQGFGVPTESYGFANKQLAKETIAPLLDRASPLRTAHLRDPVGPQIQF